MQPKDKPKPGSPYVGVERRSKERSGYTPLPPLVGVAAIAMTTACVDHRLPPTPPPDPGPNNHIPDWFDPNARWDPNGNDSQIYIAGKIVFDTDKATIKKESEPTLRALLRFIKEHPEVTRIRIEGHTDSIASNEYNQDLSARRALAVADWLVDAGTCGYPQEQGPDCDMRVDYLKLVAVGFGEIKPREPNDVAAGRAENRRTEFHVHEINGRPFAPGDPLKMGQVLTVLSPEERYLRDHPPKVDPPKRKPVVPTGNEYHGVPQPRPKDPNADPTLQAGPPK
ncbi:MAG: OmpA family protein [Polyangiaceae bacterium]